MIRGFLPTFKVFEVNNLTGLRNGHMLSQMKADANIASVVFGKNPNTNEDMKWVENGIIVGLNSDGTIGNYDASKHAQPFVHYTEEILSFLPELNLFACPIEDGVVYPRCIALYVGDAFTTNNYKGTIEGNGDGYAVVENGVLKLQASAEGAMFKATASTLPDGSTAYEFLYVNA